jgi:hypothetical protein
MEALSRTWLNKLTMYSTDIYKKINNTINIDSILKADHKEYFKQIRFKSEITCGILERLDSLSLLDNQEIHNFQPFIICEIEEKNVHINTFAMNYDKLVFMNGKFYQPDEKLFNWILYILPFYQRIYFENQKYTY